MVQTPAPNSRRSVVNPSSAAWTNRFCKASASRLSRKVLFGTLISSAYLLSGSLSSRSEANPPGRPPVFPAKIAVLRSTATVATPAAAPVASESSTTVHAAPVIPVLAAISAPVTGTPQITSQIVKSPDGMLQLEAPSTISPTVSASATPSVATPTVATPFVAPQTFSSQSSTPVLAPVPSTQPQSQPTSAPAFKIKSGARGKNRPATAGVAAKIVVPGSQSPSAVTKLAPLPGSTATSQAKTPEVAPTIQVRAIVGGQEQQAQIAVTPKMTVGQALAAMGVSLAILDRVTPDASALMRSGVAIRVTRIGAQLRKTNRAIPAELRYQPTTRIPAGAKSTIQEAKAGTLEITERVWTRDGQITKRELVSQRIAAQPRHKIIALGVSSNILPSNVRPHKRYALAYRGGTPRDRMLAPADPRTFAPVKSMMVLATGYSAGPAGGAIGNWTATGVRCTYGAVAVDPRLIPLGSKLYIEGYGYGFACDTGGAIKGKHIDLAFNSPGAAMRHGKKQVKVWILGP